MKRGTPAATAASSSTDCVWTITSLSPDSAETTQDAPRQVSVNSGALYSPTWQMAAPCCRNPSTLPRSQSGRTIALTLPPRSRIALAMRPPKSPVAPATAMIVPPICLSLLNAAGLRPQGTTLLLPHRSDRDVFSSSTNLLRGTGPVKAALEKGLGSATFSGRFRRYLANAGLPPEGLHVLHHTAAKMRRAAEIHRARLSLPQPQFLGRDCHLSSNGWKTRRTWVGERWRTR